MKEKKKKKVTETLANMKNENRHVDNLLKTHKLGRWGVANNKGVVQYDADYYDKEKQEENIGNKNSLNVGLVEDDEGAMEQQEDDLINMNEIADDDNPEGDGDEMFY